MRAGRKVAKVRHPPLKDEADMDANPLSEISLIRRLKLNQLMIFERVLETRSVVRAANEMRLTQPAVTKVIHELESCFDGALFSRSNRGVVPTELGLLLGRRVKSLMAELRYMTDELNDFRLGTSGHVIVGTLISASARLLPRAIAMLKARTPHVLVTVREGTTAHLFPALATGDLDIVVGRLPERELPIASAFPLTHEALFDESMCAVVGNGYGPVPDPAPSLRELVDAPWILPTPDSPSRLAAEHLFRAAGLPLPTDIVESLSLLTNIGLLLDTPRIALMPRVAARQFAKAGLLRMLDLPETGAFGTVGFSVRSNKEQSAACRAFIECLKEAVQEREPGN
jgi:DNA-binding transcriptional LysR family regulator